MSLRVGIDVGGTFTDFVVIGDGRQLVHKTSSTPDDPSRGFITGLGEIASRMGLDLAGLVAEIELIVHGTTVATNAVLTGNGARTGALLTDGFRDTLRLRDGTRAKAYDNRLQPPTLLAARQHTHGIAGRIGPEGQELDPLDEEAVRLAAAHLAAEDIEAVAVSFVHSPQNPEHERRTRELLVEAMPDVYITASSDLAPQIRYYPRTTTTVLNAYVGPIISRYMASLTRRLRDLKFGGVLLIMQSNGGVATPDEISRRAALSLLSGPAAAPTAALSLVARKGMADCLTVDMGGTSFDAALVVAGAPLTTTSGQVTDWPLALPTIDIHTIGAGGGSIAHVNAGGLLGVGPQSAGASPGPACYGRGGVLPTVTDADLVLGYIDQDSFLGGDFALDRAAAEQAVGQVAEQLGLSLEEAAAGIYEVVNVTMAAGVRDVTIRRGLDPRDFPMVVAGGAGPVHAAAIAAELGVPLLIVPRQSSIFCAAGMLACDFKHDHVRALKRPLGALTPSEVGAILEELVAQGRETLRGEKVPDSAIEFAASLDLRYVGQWHEIVVPLPWSEHDTPDLDEVSARFHEEHDRMFGHSSADAAVECLAVRVTAVGRVGAADLPVTDEATGDRPDRLGTRPAWSPRERRLVPTPVYDGRELAPGFELGGPAIIELPTTTVVVIDGFDVLVDARGSFVLHAGERGRALATRLLAAHEDLTGKA